MVNNETTATDDGKSPEKWQEIFNGFMQGIEAGKIEYYPEELMEKLREITFGGLPLSIVLLACQNYAIKCYDYARFLIEGFDDDAKMVWGNLASYKARIGSEHAIHFWVEHGDFVYDGAYDWKIEKD
jgi:hypothetical protein